MPANLSANVTVGPAEGSVDVQHLSCGHKVVSSELLQRKQLLFQMVRGPACRVCAKFCGIVQCLKQENIYICIYDVYISACEK